MKSEESSEEQALDQELQATTDRKKELLRSTRHIDQELWDITRRQIDIRERQQHLREQRYRKENWDAKTRSAFEMEEELQELRSENRRSAEEICVKDDEIKSLRSELDAAKKKTAFVEDVLQRSNASRKQYVRNVRQINCMGKDLDSLWRLNCKLRNQIAAADAMATETRLRQLNRLKKMSEMSAETERLRQKLSSQHQQRQEMQKQQLNEAGVHRGRPNRCYI